MCGRYTSTTPAEVLAGIFDATEIRVAAGDAPAPRYNVAPTQPVYAVATRRARDGEGTRRQLGLFRWGLVPSWARQPSLRNHMINARAETVTQRPAYRNALTRRRCIMPADAFYEWQAWVDGRGRRHRLPYAIRRRDGAPMAFAGLWEVWWDPADPDGEPLRSCAIVTTEANDLVAPIHDRMPVILERAGWDVWLDRGVEDIDAVRRLLVPAPPRVLQMWPVSTRVNNVANEGPELLEPVEAEASLPALPLC